MSTTTSAVGRGLAELRQRLEPVDPGHREVEQDELRLQPRAPRSIASSPSDASPTTSKPCCASSAASASRVSGWSSTIRMLVPRPPYRQRLLLPIRCTCAHENVTHTRPGSGARCSCSALLGAALTLFVAYPTLAAPTTLPQLRLVLDTAVDARRGARRAARRRSASRSRAGGSTCCSARASSPPRPRRVGVLDRARCSAAARCTAREAWAGARRRARSARR